MIYNAAVMSSSNMRHFILSFTFLLLMTVMVIAGGLINIEEFSLSPWLVIAGINGMFIFALGTLLTHDFFHLSWRRTLWAAVIVVSVGACVLVFIAADLLSGASPSSYLSGYRMHVITFFFVAMACTFVLDHEFVRLPLPSVISIIYTAILAASVEVVQAFVSYRTASVEDLLADAVGIMCFMVFAIWWWSVKRSMKTA